MSGVGVGGLALAKKRGKKKKILQTNKGVVSTPVKREKAHHCLPTIKRKPAEGKKGGEEREGGEKRETNRAPD